MVQKRILALHHLSQGSDWDAIHTLESIIRFLPAHLQSRRAEEAGALNQVGQEDDFEGLGN